MYFKVINIIFLSFLLFGGIICAQSLKIDAIEFVTIGQIGDEDFGGYESFISKVKNPALFESGIVNQPNKIGIISSTGFAIDFVFVQADMPANEFILGIQSGTIESEVFQELSFQGDSNLVSSDITNTSQFFTIRSGYQRVFRYDKRIKILTGTTLLLGVPVSSNTTQTLTIDFFPQEYKFFAKQSASVGLSITYGIRFKLFRNVHTAFISRPTFYFTRVDGSPTSSLLRGTNLSFQFKIRSK